MLIFYLMSFCNLLFASAQCNYGCKGSDWRNTNGTIIEMVCTGGIQNFLDGVVTDGSFGFCSNTITQLYLNGNGLTSLPPDVFDKLPVL